MVGFKYKIGLCQSLFKWCKSGVIHKISIASLCCEPIENTGVFVACKGVKWISNALRYILFSLSSGSLPQAFPIYILHIISEPVSLDKPDFMKRL